MIEHIKHADWVQCPDCGAGNRIITGAYPFCHDCGQHTNGGVLEREADEPLTPWHLLSRDSQATELSYRRGAHQGMNALLEKIEQGWTLERLQRYVKHVSGWRSCLGYSGLTMQDGIPGWAGVPLPDDL